MGLAVGSTGAATNFYLHQKQMHDNNKELQMANFIRDIIILIAVIGATVFAVFAFGGHAIIEHLPPVLSTALSHLGLGPVSTLHHVLAYLGAIVLGISATAFALVQGFKPVRR